MAKSYRESCFRYQLQAATKDLDFETIISTFCKNHGHQYSTPEEKKNGTGKFAAHVADIVQSLGPEKVRNDLQARIKELETNLAQAAIPPPMFPPAPPVTPATPAPNATASDPYKSLRRDQSQTLYLSKSAPSSKAAREVNAWIKALKNINKKDMDQQLKLELSHFDTLAQDQQTRDTDILRTVAVEWGLPFSVAGSMDAKTLIKILVATGMANKQQT